MTSFAPHLDTAASDCILKCWQHVPTLLGAVTWTEFGPVATWHAGLPGEEGGSTTTRDAIYLDVVFSTGRMVVHQRRCCQTKPHKTQTLSLAESLRSFRALELWQLGVTVFRMVERCWRSGICGISGQTGEEEFGWCGLPPSILGWWVVQRALLQKQ